MGYETVKSVTKALAILELLTSQMLEDRALTLSEIANATGMLPVTARNLLRTLEEAGYAQRVGHGQYREGERCYRLFRTEGVLRRLREVSEPVIRESVEALGESILLASLIKNKRVELLRLQTADDDLIAPHWQADAAYYQMRTTRVILAWLSPRQIESFLVVNGLPGKEDWPECEASPAGLKRELEKIRRAGGCADIHGSYVAIAVPILTAGNEVVASLGCYAPRARTDKPRTAGILSMLQECADLIQQRMGL